jgi:hypothetical protein
MYDWHDDGDDWERNRDKWLREWHRAMVFNLAGINATLNRIQVLIAFLTGAVAVGLLYLVTR